jgi:DNA helicase HerA-like ATPase
VLEQQGGESFFGEPALQDRDLMRTTRDGRGAINVLAADKLMMNAAALRDLPALAAVGTVRGTAGSRRPRQAEAGLLLRRGASAVRRRAESADRPVEQVVRLIRSKGVGVYFVTQNPLDVPETVLASSATASSMRCAPTRRANRRR